MCHLVATGPTVGHVIDSFELSGVMRSHAKSHSRTPFLLQVNFITPSDKLVSKVSELTK